MPSDFALPSSRLSCLRRGAVFVIEDPAVFWVEGPGALACLQGLLTSDLVAAGDGSLLFGALLTPKGMVVADPWVLREGERFTLVVGAPARQTVVELFRRTLPPRLARVTDLSGAWRAGWLLGAAAPDRLARALGAPVPGPGRVLRCASDPSLLLAGGTAGMPFSALLLGARAEVDAAATSLEATGAHPGTESDAAAARVLAGWPTLGREVDDKTLPQEARFDEIGGVSYTKGCYTGQETVARVHFRGHVNRQVRGLLFDPEPPAAPADGWSVVTYVDRDVGRVPSLAFVPETGVAGPGRWIGLALIRREVGRGPVVRAAGRDARVVALPFAFPIAAPA